MRTEPRTDDTRDCPDARHEHTWVRHHGADVATYHVDADGVVRLTEEALAQVLRAAGFRPTHELQESDRP